MYTCKTCTFGTPEGNGSLSVYCSKFKCGKFHADGCGHYSEKKEQNVVDNLKDKEYPLDTVD